MGLPGTPAQLAAPERQAKMYDALTPRFDRVTNADLGRDFKSEGFGVGKDGPAKRERVPFAGVTLLRDRYDVPHITAKTYDAAIETAGWVQAEDRGLLLQQARYDSRVAVVDAPGLSAIGLVGKLQNFTPSAQTEAATAAETKALEAKGREGRAVLHDIDLYLKGINTYETRTKSASKPFTRNDVYALNALKDQFLGEGGGDEARRSELLRRTRRAVRPRQGPQRVQ